MMDTTELGAGFNPVLDDEIKVYKFLCEISGKAIFYVTERSYEKAKESLLNNDYDDSDIVAVEMEEIIDFEEE